MPNLPTPGGSDVWGADLNAAIESLHLGPDAHANRPTTGLTAGTLYSCTDHGLVYRWSGSAWGTWATLGGGAGGWDLVVDEPGDSVSNFTAFNGTFAVVAGTIQGTPNSNECLAVYNLPVATSMFVLEAEIQILVAGGASSDTHAGFVAGCSSTAGPGISSRLHSSGGNPDKVETEVNATAGRVSTVIDWGAHGEWHKLRQVVGGGVCAVYVDGSLIHTAGNNAQQSNDASRFALRVGNCSAQFRNLKAWVPTLPL